MSDLTKNMIKWLLDQPDLLTATPDEITKRYESQVVIPQVNAMKESGLIGD